MKVEISERGRYNVKNIKINVEKTNEVDAKKWIEEIKKGIEDIDFDYDKIIVNCFIEIEKNLKFDFYQFIHFIKLLEDFLKKEIKTEYIIFRLHDEVKLELTSSKIKDFECKNIKVESFDFEGYNHFILVFDVGNDFFNSLKIENKKIIFEGGDYEIGFKKPILIDKIESINSWGFSKDLIFYPKSDFENFYNFVKSAKGTKSVIYTTSDKFFLNFKKIKVDTCEQFSKIKSLTPNVDFKDDDINCEKIEIKDFGKFYKDDGVEILDFSDFEFGEVVINNNIKDFVALEIKNKDKFENKGNLTLKNLKNIEKLVFHTTEFENIKIENCNLDDLFLRPKDLGIKEDLNKEVEIKNVSIDDTLEMPFYYLKFLKGKNIKTDVLKIEFSNDFIEKNIKFNRIFNEFLKCEYNEDEFKKIEDDVIKWLYLFFKFKIKECNCNLYEYLDKKINDIFKYTELKLEIRGYIDALSDLPDYIKFIGKNLKNDDDLNKMFNFVRLQNSFKV